MIDRNDIYYIDLTRNGDTAAYSYLVERYSDMVYSLALKMLKNQTDAEDLAQEIFIAAYKSLSSFKGGSKFSTWLYRITYNKAISRLRKTDRISLTESDQILENKSEHDFQRFGLSKDEEDIQLLQKEINELPDEEQLLILLHYFEDQSVDEIAKVTLLTVANVKVKLFRIRKKLKGKMENRIPEIIPVIS
ncbi:MAG: RNA polymerase sigma factor [Prolixibacteraceae bacterium]|jgi:RNA polymerase sigma factor (sigma-70 family)|nr:RNA polymerase sigma factor [Prolixibacteraceae bacterium]